MTWEQAVGQFGLPGAMAIWIGYREILPWVLKQWFPAWAERRKAADETAAKEREAQRAADREILNRLFGVIEQNSAAYAALKVTLDHVVTQLTQQTELLGELNEDVSGLYAHVGKKRPSRVKAEVGGD